MNLAQLITDRKASRSYAVLARDCGGTPSDKRLQQLAKYPIKEFPDPATIRALAKGLRVTEATVVMAVAETLGLDVSREELTIAHRLPLSADRLPDEQKDALVALVLSMTPKSEQEEGGGEGDAGGAPQTSPPGSGPVPTHPTALRLLNATDWDPEAAMDLVGAEPDNPETALAADEIRALLPLTPDELLAARRSAEHPPPMLDEPGGES